MARTIFSLVGRIRTEGFEGVQKKLSEADKAFTKLANKVDRVGKNVSKAGMAITKLTAPITILGAAAIKFGADFDKAMTGSLAIMGDVSDAMKKDMSDAARAVAKTTTFSATQAAEAYYFLASAGLDAAKSIGALPRVAAFAQAGNFDLALATDLLTDAQSALGLSSKDATENLANMTRVSDVLVKANTLANASVQQFSEALTNKAGAALRMLNKSVEEGAAVLAVYADQGLKGAGAGESLGIVMRDLQKASISNRDAFKKAGVTVFDSTGKMRNMADIVADLERRLLGMSDEQRRTELTTLGFTDKSINATTALLGTSEAIRGYEKNLRAAGGTTDDVAGKQLKSFSAQMTIIKNKLVDVGLSLWEAIGPVMMRVVVPGLEKLTKLISGIAEDFARLPKGIQGAIVVLLGLTAAAGPVLIVVGKIISSVKLLSVAFHSLNLAMMANPWVLAATAILGVAAALYTAEKNARSLREELTTGVANKALSDQKKYLEQIIPLYGEMLTASYSAMDSSRVAELKKEIGDLETNLADLGVTLEGGLEKRMESANNALTDLEESTASAGEEVKNFVDLTKTETESLEQAAARAKALAEERKKLSAEWSQRRALQTASELEAIDIEEKAEIDKANAIKASEQTLSDIRAYYTEKRVQVERTAAKAIEDINKEWSDKVRAQIMTRSDLLEWSYRDAIIAARERGADTNDIELYYDNERAKLRQEEARDKDKLREEEMQKESEKQDKIKGLAMQAVEWLIGLGQQETDLRLSQLDQQTEAKRAQVMAATMDEETRALRLAEIDEESDKKKRVLMVKQAKRDKAAAVFATLINTFQAISKALTLGFPLGLIMAAVFGALGAAQVAMIAAKPLPQLAEGGMVRKRPGGVQAVIGEGSQDEIVLPMKTGAAELATQIIQGLAGMVLPPSLPAALAGGGGLTAAAGAPFSGGRGGDTHLHVGTLIADDSGLRNLERSLFKFRAQESNRRGA